MSKEHEISSQEGQLRKVQLLKRSVLVPKSLTRMKTLSRSCVSAVLLQHLYKWDRGGPLGELKCYSEFSAFRDHFSETIKMRRKQLDGWAMRDV